MPRSFAQMAYKSSAPPPPTTVTTRPYRGPGCSTDPTITMTTMAYYLAKHPDWQERVRAESNGKQTPWVVRRELFGDFVIAPARR